MFRWLKGLWGRAEWPDPQPRFVDLPGQEREPSQDLLCRLRNLDPRAEVVYRGEGRWWVGRVKPNSPRRRSGRRLAWLCMLNDGLYGPSQWATRSQGILMAQGFGLCVDIRLLGIPDGRLVTEFSRFLALERGRIRDDKETPEEERIRDRQREAGAMERDLAKWMFHRGGIKRTNAWVGAGSNSPTGSLIHLPRGR